MKEKGRVSHRIQALRGNKPGECGLYCCDEHKSLCDVYNASSKPKFLRGKIEKARCNQSINRESLLQLQIDEYNYNFCEVCGEKKNTSELFLHHTNLVSKDPEDADNMAGQILVCSLHHKHKGCFDD